jgi:imidazolonepropionase
MRELGIIPDGAVLIRDGLVEQPGVTRRIENLDAARGAVEIDAGGRVVMPGFVDSHTHLFYGSADADLDDAGERPSDLPPVAAGVLRHLRLASARRIEARARLIIEAMVRHGTTTLEVKCGNNLGLSVELKLLRVLSALNRQPLELTATSLATPPGEGRERARQLEWICSQLLPKLRRRKLACCADVSCERDAFTPEEARRYLIAARKLGFLLKVHTDQMSRCGGVPLAVELGAASVDHLEYAATDDLALLAQSQTIATLLPGFSHYLGRPFACARELIERGAAVALATNFHPHTSPTYSMQMVLSLACSHMNMTAAEAITAATINGAHALGMADTVGSLEPGKHANLVLFNASDYREIVHPFGVNQVHMVIVRGMIVYQEGRVRRNLSDPTPP